MSALELQKGLLSWEEYCERPGQRHRGWGLRVCLQWGKEPQDAGRAPSFLAYFLHPDSTTLPKRQWQLQNAHRCPCWACWVMLVMIIAGLGNKIYYKATVAAVLFIPVALQVLPGGCSETGLSWGLQCWMQSRMRCPQDPRLSLGEQAGLKHVSLLAGLVGRPWDG